VGQLLDNENEYYKAWLLKLDACGDLVWTGCPPIVGVEELQRQDSGYKIYPNPMDNWCTFERINAETKCTLSLADVTGKQLWHCQMKTDQHQQTIETSQLAPSSYLLQVKDAMGLLLWSTLLWRN